MPDEEKQLEIQKEISTIINKTYSSKLEAQNKIAEIKKLIPEKEQAYKPSGKTSALALTLMALGVIPSTLIAILIVFITDKIFMLILNIIWWFTDMIGISRIVPFIFLIISFPFAIIFPFLIAGGSAGMLIAQIGKIGKNRNVFFASLFATLPFVFLFIISIIGQFTEPLGFNSFPRDAEPFAIRITLFFISVLYFIVGVSSWFGVDSEVKEQKFDEQKKKYYRRYESDKMPVKLAPYVTDLSINTLEQNHKLKEAVDISLGEYKNFLRVNIYKFPSHEIYHKGYIDIFIEITLKYKNSEEKDSVDQSWCILSESFEKDQLEQIFSFFNMKEHKD